jgi:branched-chain amino acid aminotransferase
MQTADLIWMDGEFLPWEDAKVHVLSHAFHYGTSVFEGVRAYETENGPAIFRHQDHLDRLEASAKLYYMDLPFSKEQIRTATHELISRNGFKSCYIRPLVFRGYGPMGLDPEDNPIHVSIAAWEWGAYLGDDAKRDGVRAKVSSWRRISPQSLIPHAKAGGQYLNSVLAKIESKRAGYQEAILLDDKGHVCEGTGENIFVVKDGVLATPGQTASILDGISRKSIIEIATDLGYEVQERDVARAELVLADEVFLVGTAAELTPVREIDDIELGPPGEITRQVQAIYDDALRGRVERYSKWLDVVPVPSKA